MKTEKRINCYDLASIVTKIIRTDCADYVDSEGEYEVSHIRRGKIEKGCFTFFYDVTIKDGFFNEVSVYIEPELWVPVVDEFITVLDNNTVQTAEGVATKLTKKKV